MKPTDKDILAYDGSVPVSVAAKYLGVTKTFIYSAMQHQLIPIGTACKGEKEWMYDIRPMALVEYNQHGGVKQFTDFENFIKAVMINTMKGEF